MRITHRHPAYPSLRALAMTGAAVGLALAFGSSAVAQTAPLPAPSPDISTLPVAQDPDEEATDLDDVVVTGTSIRGIRPVGSATVPLTREDIQQTGLTSTADVVRTLPQLQNLASTRRATPAPRMRAPTIAGAPR